MAPKPAAPAAMARYQPGVWLLLGLLASLLLAPSGAAAAQRKPKPSKQVAANQPNGGTDIAEAEAGTSPAPAKGAADSAKPSPPPRIGLNEHLRLLLRPVVMGLVPPPDPQGYGECLLRLTQASAEELGLHYEIKERRALPAKTSTYQLIGVDDTQIRRGELRLARQAALAPGLLPLSAWPPGVHKLDGGLLWLSGEQWRSLKSSGRLRWGAEAAPLVVSDPAARYPCVVNGREVLLPALRASDGQADYWILDDPDNPLVLKLSGASLPPGAEAPPKTAANAPPGPAAQQAHRQEADKDEVLGLVNGAERARAETNSETLAADSAEPRGDAELQSDGIGIGFAVVEIDF